MGALRILFFLVVLMTFCTYSHLLGQTTGKLNGTVSDESTGESLIGVNVVLVGTTIGASTDMDGHFMIQRIPAGKYDVRISMVGYATKLIQGVNLPPDQTVNLNFSLAPESYSMQEIVISAEAVMSSESAVLAQRKKAASIGDAISLEQIKRTPDATAGDALRRVTGLSIVENKFVFIRGVTDRYNLVTLNGTSMASTETEKKSFSLDLLPSNLLENTVVIKSSTPDLPGDFTGGLVQFNTLEFPEKRTIKISVSGSYNSNTTSRDMRRTMGGENFLGFDDGKRQFIENLDENFALPQSLPNSWRTERRIAPFGNSFSLSMGDRIDLFERPLGVLAAISYRRNFQKTTFRLDDRDLAGDERTLDGFIHESSISWGGLVNISYQFSDYQKFSFKNNFNHSGTDKVSENEGIDPVTTYQKNFGIVWTQRSTYTGQLMGEHNFPDLAGIDFHWRLSLTSGRRTEPDRKEISYTRSDLNDPFIAQPGRRSWETLSEVSRGAAGDLKVPLGSLSMKIGSSYEKKVRSFNIRFYETLLVNKPLPESYGYALYDIDSIYDPSHYGAGKWRFRAASKASDKYEAEQSIFAGYVMFDVPFAIFDNRLRFAGGARLENSDQIVYTTSRPSTVDLVGVGFRKVDILPSANLTYSFNDNTNLRLAYNHSVNRPEFREMASLAFYDFINYETVEGNPNLQRAYIKNYDIRFEAFPEAGEVLAVSYFNKQISSAIEEELVQASSVPSRRFFNSNTASNHGWEFELRKSLRFLGGYFENFSVTGNYSRIFSKVEFIRTSGNSTNTVLTNEERPLQGQSPYMINLGLLWNEPTSGTSVNILYTKNGERLDAVGFLDDDVYEPGRDLVDIIATHNLFNLLEAKFSIRDLNGKDRVLTKRGLIYRSESRGTTYSLQLSTGL